MSNIISLSDDVYHLYSQLKDALSIQLKQLEWDDFQITDDHVMASLLNDYLRDIDENNVDENDIQED